MNCWSLWTLKSLSNSGDREGSGLPKLVYGLEEFAYSAGGGIMNEKIMHWIGMRSLEIENGSN